jgi:hypothetical protein
MNYFTMKNRKRNIAIFISFSESCTAVIPENADPEIPE